MLIDLIWALLAAAAVGVVPGWFWASCLCPPAEDRAMRFTLSTALSLALVPAVALAQVRLFDSGVTLAVTVASVSLVFLGGLAAYLRFGPAKGPQGPLAPLPSPIDVPALMLLLPALGITLWAVVGPAPAEQQYVISMMLLAPATLLALAAGVTHLLSRGGGVAQPDPAPDTPGAGGWWVARRLALPAVLLLVLVRGYLGPVLNDWPFIRGVDHYSHAVMANRMLTEGEISPYLIYPPGFHAMTALISRLSGLDPLEIFPVLGPALLLLPALALYALARRVWGWEYGVAAAACTLLLGGTYYYYNDAMYPNLVTSQFLLVLALVALINIYFSPAVRSGLLFALLGSSAVLYHQVGSLYEATLLFVVTVLFLPYLLTHERRKGLVLLSSFALLGALSVLYAWDTYDLGGLISDALSGGMGESATGDAVNMAVGTQLPYDPEFLIGVMVSQPVAMLSVFGAFLLLRALRDRVETPQVLSYITLLAWALLLFVGSRTALVGFPQRFGRDLGIPLALLAAFAFVALARSQGRVSRRPVAVFITSLAVMATGTLVGLQAVQNIEEAAGPSIQLTITPEIAAAGEWLEENNEGGNIMISPHVNQVPSRMMLAMGDYSALQSFEAGQIAFPRDLPPTGPEPLEDVLWVMNHPEDEHTSQLLEEHDVRYIVLYKNMPDRYTTDVWKLFKAQPDLYRTAFENEDVLIVARRQAPARSP